MNSCFRSHWFIVLYVTTILCLFQGVILFQTNHAIGLDGYYYAAQVKSFTTKGRFFSPDSSLYLKFLVLLSKTGIGIVITQKIAILLFTALGTLATWMVAGLYFRGNWRVLCLILLAGSSLFTALRTEFPKNFAGFVFFLFFFISFTEATGYRKRKYILYSILLFFASFYTHKLTAALCIWILFWQGIRLFPKKGWLFLLPMVAILFFINQFLPNSIQLSEVVGGKGIFQSSATFIPPELIKTIPSGPFRIVEITFLYFVSIAGFFLFGIRTFVKFKNINTVESANRKLSVRISIALIALLILFPFWDFSSGGAGSRIALFLFLPGMIFLVYFLRLGISFLHTYKVISGGKRMNQIVLIGLLALFPTFILLQIPADTKTSGPDYNEVEVAVQKLNLPENHLLIVHQGFDYYYCYQKKGDAFHFLPEKKHAGRPIFRLAYGVPESMIRKKTPDIRYEIVTSQYMLMTESDWLNFVETLSPMEKQILLGWRNPMTERTEVMKMRKIQK